jgi:hypothetical protein
MEKQAMDQYNCCVRSLLARDTRIEVYKFVTAFDLEYELVSFRLFSHDDMWLLK